MMHSFLRHRQRMCIRLKRSIAAVTLMTMLTQMSGLTQLSAFSSALAIPKAEAATGIFPAINYQGRITGINGTSVANGKYNVRFKIYTAAIGGSPVWSETWDTTTQQVTMTGGLFSVPLGTHVTMTGSVNFNTDNIYLQIEFDDDNNNTYTEIFTPRRRFGSVPYAHNANMLDGLDSTKFVRKDQPETLSGTLTIKPNVSSVLALKAIGTLSGTAIHADQDLSASGNIIAEGTISGSSLYAGTSIRGGGLTDCDAASSRLLWDATTGRFSCGTISPSFSTGNVLTIGNAKYVSKQGDTMTGALVINIQSGSLGSMGLRVINTLSGAIIHAEKELTSSGTLMVKQTGTVRGSGALTVVNTTTTGTGAYMAANDAVLALNSTANTVAASKHILFGYKGTFDTTLWRSAANVLSTNGTFSGASLYADNTIRGAGLADCDDGVASKLLWDATSGRFSCGTDQSGSSGLSQAAGDARYVKKSGDTMTGVLVIQNGNTHTPTGTALLNVRGTISGTTLYANSALRSSGSITAEGAISGSSLYAGTSIRGAGLSDCDTASSALQWDATTGRFSCGTITGSSFSTGNVLTIGNAKYVSKQGDTMTGALVINVQGGTLGTIGLKVLNTLSGAIIHAEKELTSSGTLMVKQTGTTRGSGALTAVNTTRYGTGAYITASGSVLVLNTASTTSRHILFGYAGNFDTALWRSGAATLSTNGTFSGVTLYANSAIRSSGSIVAEGAISGSSLYAGTSIRGAGLTDCDTSATSKLLWDATTGRFSCGTDQAGGSFSTGNVLTIGNAKYVSKQGDTMTGALVINMQGGTMNTVGLNVMNTISGAIIHAEKSLTSSGTLAVEGAATVGGMLHVLQSNGEIRLDTGGAGNTSTLSFYDGSQRATISNNQATFTFAISTQNTLLINSSDYIAMSAPNYVNINNIATFTTAGLGLGTATPDTPLEVIGTISGSTVYAANALRSSGSITAEGAISGSSLYAGTSIRGAGLSDCDTSATSKLLWDATTGRFSCGTDAAGGGFSTGNVLTIGNAKYVSKQGDTMTGALVINMQGGSLGSIGLRVLNTLSGAIIHAEKELTSSGTLMVKQTGTTRGSGALTAVNTTRYGTGAYITASGSVLVLNTASTTSRHILFGYAGNFDTALWRSGAATLSTNGTFSGVTLYANSAIRSSGSVVAEGAISGSSLYAGTSISGAGLSDCDTSATSKLLWDATTGRFSCGTDSSGSFSTGNVLTLGNARYVELKGDSMTGSLQTPSINLSGVLLTNLNGFNEALNLNNAGLATYGVTRLQANGNLTNIGSVQSGEIHATMGGTFAAKVDYTVGNSPFSVAMGDLNGDGVQDLVASNYSNNSVSVLLNNGNGTFATKADYATGSSPYFVTVGDLNGDGKLDIVTPNNGTTTISVLLNNGNGTFGAKVDYTTGSSPKAVAIGDLNGDGKADLAVANSSSALSIFMNKGNGTFAAKVDYTTGSTPFSVAIGDLNGDGRLDVVTANNGTTTVSAFLNKGDGTFAIKADYTVGGSPYSVAIGDLNGDGKADLATANGGTSASVLINNGNGTFATKVDYTTGSLPYSIAIGDINGDGKADLGVANYTSNTISTLQNRGNGTFATKVDYAAGANPASIAIGDLNGDGKADLATANGGTTTVSVFLNNTKTILYASSGTGGTVGIGTSTPGAKLAVSGSVLIGNNITNRATKTNVGLEVIGTISGAIVTANTLRSSGSIVAEGTISGANLYIGTSIRGAGLVNDCDTASTSKLLWDSTTGRFSCGTDTAGGGFSTGNVITIGNANYVKKAGDTMTGTLVIDIKNGTLGSLGLRVLNTLSGAIIHAEKELTSSGTLMVKQTGTTRGSGALTAVNTTRYGTGSYMAASGAILVLDSTAGGAGNSKSPHILFGYKGTFDVSLARTAANTLSLTGSFLPGSTNRYDLGSSTMRWRDLYLSGSSLHIGTNGNEATVGYNTAGSYFTVGTSSQTNAFTILNSNGFVGIGTNNADTKLEVIGTISGSTVYAANALRSSGSMTAEGAISGSSLYAGTSISGAGLSDCDTGATSKLLWDATTGRFSCGTDQTGTSSSFSTGNVLTIGNAKYVSKQGDTMTGALVINIQGGSLGSMGLRVINTLSGAIIHAEKELTSSGTLMVKQTGTTRGSGALTAVNTTRYGTGSYMAASGAILVLDSTAGGIGSSKSPHILFGYKGNFDIALWRSAANVLSTNGTFSGSVLRADRLLTSSGSLAVESGAYIGGDVRFDAARNHVISVQGTTGTTGKGLSIVAGDAAILGGALVLQGGTNGTNRAAITLNGTGDLGGDISVIAGHASNTAEQGGNLTLSAGNGGNNPGYVVIAGGANSFTGAGGSVYIYGGDGVSAGSGNVMLGMTSAGVAAGNVGIRTLNPGTALEVNGTISGSILFANSALRSSGSITAEGTISGANLYVGTSIQGAGLTDCDTGATSKLLWDTTTGRFSCGTDQTGGGSSSFSTGNVLTIGSAKYVSKQGDTMTGALQVPEIRGNDATAINTRGTNLVVAGGRAQGSASGGDILFKTAPTNTASAAVAANFVAANTEYLSIGDNADLSFGDEDFSIAGWVYFNSLTGGGSFGTIVGKYNTGANEREYSVYLPSGTNKLRFVVTNNGSVANGILDSTVSVTTGTWYFVYAEHDSVNNELVLKVNDNTADTLSYSLGGRDGASTFALGNMVGLSSAQLDGRLDEIAIYNRVLTPTELTYLYNGGAGRVYGGIGIPATDGSDLTTSLISWWDLDETSGSRADSHGSNTLTDNNTVTSAAGNVSASSSDLNTLVSRMVITSSGAVGIGTITPGSTLAVSGATIINGRGTTNTRAKAGLALEVIGTISGSTVYAASALRSSGSITAEGTISGASLYIGGSMRGAGLVSDCDTASTSKLLWDSTTGRFSCGTDYSSSFSTGNVLTLGGARYVELKGDSMTGSLQTPSVNLSGVLLTSLNGHNQVLNLNNAGLATYGVTRMSADGNLNNIGSIQSGEIHATTNASFGTAVTYTVGSGPRGSAIGDLNGDGRGDVVVTNASTTTISVLLNTGSGKLAAKTDYTVGNFPYVVVIGDLNGDGKQDLATANSGGNTMSVLLNTGSGKFATHTTYATGTAPRGLVIADFNRDGKPDLVTANYSSNTISVFINKGNGTFATKADYAAGSGPFGMTTGDYNGDGHADVAVANSSTTTMSVLMNDGDGTFGTKVDYITGTTPLNPTTADFDGDGKADLAVVNNGSTTVSVFINSGTGSFRPKVDYATGAGPNTVTSGDLNGDGKPDMAVSNFSTTTVSIYINNGNGTFATQVPYTAGSNPLVVSMADMNGDGKADLVMPLWSNSAVAVLFNRTSTLLYASAGTGGYVSIGTPHMKAKLTVSNTNNGVMTGAYIYSSGAVLALDARTLSGAKTPHLLFGYRGNFDTRITRTAVGSLTFASQTGALVTLDTERSDATGNVFQIISDATTSFGGPDENKVFRIQANGATFADGAYTSNGADYAEWFYSGNEKLKSGEVVCIDITKNNTVKRCLNEADSNVMGIVSTNPAFIGNGITGADGIIPPGYALIGLIGQVPTKVIVSGTGSIRPGDALTPASTPGYARKAMPGESTVGVALEGIASGEGVINVLISRRNSSMTVDAVGQKVLDTIASMKIGDEVQLMVASSLENLNVDSQIQEEVQKQVSGIKSYDADIQSLQAEIDDLKNQLALIKSQTGSTTTVITTTGSALAADLTAATLVLEQTLATGGDARIGGDLHLDGTLMASSLFVPNGLSIDGGATITGTLAATTIHSTSGATIDGTLTVNGDIRISSGSLLFDSGATLSLSDLVVERSLIILGDITIDGLARFFGNVIIHGELILSNKQAGFALIPKSGTSVTVLFGSGGLSGIPVVTASPDTPVLYGVKNATHSGFTINLAGPATADIRFSWIAMVTENAMTQTGAVALRDTSMIFPMGSDNIPVSSSMYWNACIRNIAIIDTDGKPHSCARYHVDYTWTHPDLLIEFLWNTNITPPLLHLPDGYTLEVTEDAESIRGAFTFGTNEAEPVTPEPTEGMIEETPAEPIEEETTPEEAASDTPASEDITPEEPATETEPIETTPADTSASETPSESSLDELTINPVVTEPEPEPAAEPTTEVSSPSDSSTGAAAEAEPAVTE